jgi:hypothetical protein
MAIIRFTAEDREKLRNPFDSDSTLIGFEESPDCIGEDCGERIFHSEEDEIRYGLHSQKPMGLHSHLVQRGINPAAGPRRIAVFRKKEDYDSGACFRYL